MAKEKTVYFCSECGGESPVWKGSCPHCHVYNTMTEHKVSAKKSSTRSKSWTGQTTVMQDLEEINPEITAKRYSSGITEFDRALGGGLVTGSVILLGGDPGIGKSTLLLQTLATCKEKNKLYVSGEESAGQIANRAKRLQLNANNVSILAETKLEQIIDSARIKFKEDKGLLIIDSIQTMYTEDLTSAPGTVSQVRECSVQLTRLAKENGITIVLVGHVTKDGGLAGPRVLEHLVDTVLYFEGDKQSPYRLVRAFKNRFGSAQELGAFEMTETGLLSIDNPSSMFLTQTKTNVSGSSVFVCQEGTRPLLLEIQALMDETQNPQPRRLAVGVDYNRLAMILAVLHKHGSLVVNDQDVFVNAVGGLKIQEPAADLAIIFALVSSLREKKLPQKMVCFGEVGLTGELRAVQHSIDRLKEASRLGFTYAIIPKNNIPKEKIKNMHIIGVENLTEALSELYMLENQNNSC